MRRFRPVLPALALLAACSSEPPTGPITSLPRPLTQAETDLVSVGNRFTFSLFQETLRQEQPGANVFVSPLSVSMALGMTLNGAAGATETGMRQALALGNESRDDINAAYKGLIQLLRGLDPHATFTIANSIWYRNTFQFLPEFLDVNRASFDAQVQGLDFASPQAAATINGWVNDQTAGRIPEIVPAPLPHDVVMYLINAIYFKASWTRRFNPQLTQPAPFQLAGGGTVQVPMMSHGTEITFLGRYDSLAQVADLPYGGGAFSMTIVLPAAGRSVDSVARYLTNDVWNNWMASLDSTRMAVHLPRFTMKYDLERAVPVLKALGMAAAFCDAPSPDFTRMSAGGQLCISDVKHKTFVQVDEAGTEAAAATSVGIQPTSLPPQFTVDRPFIFVIRERFSGTILFIGKIMNPITA